jgi:hypothetical protein
LIFFYPPGATPPPLSYTLWVTPPPPPLIHKKWIICRFFFLNPSLNITHISCTHNIHINCTSTLNPMHITHTSSLCVLMKSRHGPVHCTSRYWVCPSSWRRTATRSAAAPPAPTSTSGRTLASLIPGIARTPQLYHQTSTIVAGIDIDALFDLLLKEASIWHQFD